MNYYELLEISPSASVEVVKNAYKTLAKKYHPDTYRGDPDFADAKMKLLNEAVSVLEDEGKRSEYNKINGINPLSKSGYSDYGKNNMLNFDENGEPIFFSYDDLGGDDSDVKNGGKSSDEYINIIDNFFNDRKSEKKSKSAKNKDYITDDIVDDISNISNISNSSNGSSISEIEVEETGENEIDDYGDIYYSDETEQAGTAEELKPFNIKRAKSRTKSRAKSQSNKSRLYYIVLASLIAVDILLGVLVVQSVDWKNIKDIMSGVSGSQNGGSEKVGNFGIDEENTSGDEIYTTAYEQTPSVIAPATEPSIENTDEITIQPAETSAAVTASESATTTNAPAATKPKATNPPETTVNITAQPQTEPTVLQTTQAATEPVTAEITAPAITTEETTEAPTTTETPTTELITEAPTTEEPVTEAPATEPITEAPTTELVTEAPAAEQTAAPIQDAEPETIPING